MGIYEQSPRPRPDPVLFQSWGTLNVMLIVTEIVEDAASIIRKVVTSQTRPTTWRVRQ